jgi:hypothetical protein
LRHVAVAIIRYSKHNSDSGVNRMRFPGDSRRRLGCVPQWAALALWLAFGLAISGPASAGSDRPAQTGAAAAAHPADAGSNPFARLTDWVDHSVRNMREGLAHSFAAFRHNVDHTGQSLKGAAATATGKLDSLQHLHMQVVHQRQRCAPAANGAPDCRHSAEMLCRAHGFSTGKSLEIQTEENCRMAALLGGSTPAPCRDETYIVSTMCQ